MIGFRFFVSLSLAGSFIVSQALFPEVALAGEKDSEDTYLSEKTKKLDDTPGVNAFSNKASDEDKEITAAIAKLKNKNKTPLEIKAAVAAIEKRHREKREKRALEKKRRLEKEAEIEYRNEIKAAITAISKSEDILSYVKLTLLNQLLDAPRSRKNLDSINDSVQNNLSQLIPFYIQLADQLPILNELISNTLDYPNIETDEAHHLALTQALNTIRLEINTVQELYNKILKLEKEISFETSLNLESPLVDIQKLPTRASIFQQLQPLLKHLKTIEKGIVKKEKKATQEKRKRETKDKKQAKDAKRHEENVLKKQRQEQEKLEKQIEKQKREAEKREVEALEKKNKLAAKILKKQNKQAQKDREKARKDLAKQKVEIYQNLKSKIKEDSKNDTLSPLLKSITRNLFKKLSSSELTQVELNQFYTDVERHYNFSATAYLQLEKIIAEVEIFKDKNTNEINWDSIALKDTESPAIQTLQALIRSLKTAHDRRKCLLYPYLNPHSEDSIRNNYHGNHKATENQANLILSSYQKSKRNQTLISIGKRTGVVAGAILLGPPAMGVGIGVGVVAAPFWLLGKYFIFPTGKWIQNKNQERHESKARKADLKIANQKAYDTLKNDLHEEVNDLQTTLLKKHILTKFIDQIPLDANTVQLKYFKAYLNRCITYSSLAYVELDTALKKLKPFATDANETLNWSTLNFTHPDIRATVEKAISLKHTAKLARNCIEVPSVLTMGPYYLGSGDVIHFKGDFIEAENEVREIKKIYKSFIRAEMLNSIKTGASSTGSALVSPFLAIYHEYQNARDHIHNNTIKKAIEKDHRIIREVFSTQLNSLSAESRIDDLESVKSVVYARYLKKLTRENLDGSKDETSIEREAKELTQLFILKTKPVKTRLNELIPLVETNQHDTHFDIAISKKTIELLKEKLYSIFLTLLQFQADFTLFPDLKVSDFNEIEKQAEQLAHYDSFIESKKIELNKAISELNHLKQQENKSQSDIIYLSALEETIDSFAKQIKNKSLRETPAIDILQYARDEANRKLGQKEEWEQIQLMRQKDHLRMEEKRKAKICQTHQSVLDDKIYVIIDQASSDPQNSKNWKNRKNREQLVQRFLKKYPHSSDLPGVPYSEFQKATHDLEAGTWHETQEYTANKDQRNMETQIEAREVYPSFLSSRPKMMNPNSNETSGHIVSDLPEVENNVLDSTDPLKSSETFLKNYITLPSEPNFTTDSSKCSICFEPVIYDFKALSEFSDVPPQFDRLIQVPSDSNAHKLSICGHLTHKECMNGHEMNKGLSLYKCPKCAQPIPYHEMNTQEWKKKYGYSLDIE